MRWEQKNKKNLVFNLKTLACVGFLAFVFLFHPAGVSAATCHDVHSSCSSSQVCYQGSCTTRAALGIPNPQNGGTCSTNSNDVVKSMQSAIGMTGNDVDGICGGDTITAIQVFQKNHGLTPDGLATLDGQTVLAMGLRGVQGSDCGSDFPICGQGLSCGSDNKCAVAGSGGGTPPVNPSTTPSSSAPCDQSTCPAGLCMVNGICLPPNSTACTGGICSSNSLTDLLIKVITLLLTVAGIIAVLMLIVGGFWYITSAGNEEQSEKGKKAITNAIIGVIVVLLSYAIVSALGSLINTGK